MQAIIRFMLGAAAAACAIMTTSNVQATVWITGDPGGLMAQYAARYAMIRRSGEKVVIDGPCYSACTMVLGFVPRDRVCVTENAVLGFHAAFEYDQFGRKVTSSEGTRALMGTYPRAIRNWIARRGGLKPEMIYLRGRELASMYAMCR